MPIERGLHAIFNQALHQVGTDDVLAKAFLLQQLEVVERRAGVGEVLEVGRLGPVLQVVEVGDKGGLGEELLSRKVVEIERICKRLDKLCSREEQEISSAVLVEKGRRADVRCQGQVEWCPTSSSISNRV